MTTVAVAKTGTNSLRVTIPEAIVAYLKLEAGDKINWTMENKGKTCWSELTLVNALGGK